MRKMSTLLAGLIPLFISLQVFADDPQLPGGTVPEPGALALLAIGAAAAAIAWRRGKNKKK